MRLFSTLCFLFLFGNNGHAQQKLNVMVIFAHPDEGEIYTGGITALYTKLGHNVKFLSLTNGDAGSYHIQPVELARLRYNEAMESKKILGLSDYEVLDYHDKFLKNTIESQNKVIKSIEAFKPDIVFTYYPAQGGHTDNRTAGYIVRDAAPRLKMEKQPVFFYVRDFHTSTLSYIPDFAVPIDSVWQTKLAACTAHQTQVADAIPYKMGVLEEVKASIEKQAELIYNNTYPFSKVTPDIKVALNKWIGTSNAATTKYAEAFSIAEFGRQPTDKEITQLLPLLGKMETD